MISTSVQRPQLLHVCLTLLATLALLETGLARPAMAQPPTGGVPFGVLISEQAQASFNLLGAGARAAGMGGAFTAIADDATAASFNPAGLAQLLVPEASLVIDYRRLEDGFVSFTSFDQQPPLPLTDSATSFDHVEPSFLSVTLPFRWLQRRWAFQLSAQELVDFTYRADLDFFENDVSGAPLFELQQVNRQDGSIKVFSASLALAATRRALVGLTVNRWDGSWDFTSFNAEAPVSAPTAVEQFRYRQSNQLEGWNVDLGVLLRYKYANVGLRYRLPFDADYRIRADLETNLPTPLSPLRESRTTLRWPGTVNVGVAFKPTDRFTFAIDWSQTDWSAMKLLLPGATEEVSFFDLQPESLSGASSVDSWRLGGEYIFLSGSTVLPVRAGWFREPQPATDQVTGDRLVSDGLSLGFGVKRGAVSVDLAVIRKTSDTNISRFLEPDELEVGLLRATSRGRRDRTETSVLLSFIVQVPRGSKIARALHWLFVAPNEPTGESGG